jgi:hypothetical protein
MVGYLFKDFGYNSSAEVAVIRTAAVTDLSKKPSRL